MKNINTNKSVEKTEQQYLQYETLTWYMLWGGNMKSRLGDNKGRALKETTGKGNLQGWHHLWLLAVGHKSPELVISKQGFQGRDWNNNSLTQPSTYNLSYLWDVLGYWWHRDCGSGLVMIGQAWNLCHKSELILDTYWSTRTQRLDGPWT